MLWCFLGIFGDRNRRNAKIFLKCGCKVGAGCGSACLPFGVSAGCECAGSLCYFADVSNIGQDAARCSAFYSPCRSALGALLANMALFRVLRRFIWVYRLLVWVCVALVLCLACVAFVRVWS